MKKSALDAFGSVVANHAEIQSAAGEASAVRVLLKLVDSSGGNPDLQFLFAKKKSCSYNMRRKIRHHATTRASWERMPLHNARTLCRYETSFLVYFFKFYKVVFRLLMRISKLRSGRPPKVRFREFLAKRTNFARRVWWRHSASGPEIVARAMLNNKSRL